MINPESIAILRELKQLGEVPADHFKGHGMYVAILVKKGFAEWLRNNPRKPHLATSLRITEAGRLTDTGSVT